MGSHEKILPKICEPDPRVRGRAQPITTSSGNVGPSKIKTNLRELCLLYTFANTQPPHINVGTPREGAVTLYSPEDCTNNLTQVEDNNERGTQPLSEGPVIGPWLSSKIHESYSPYKVINPFIIGRIPTLRKWGTSINTKPFS